MGKSKKEKSKKHKIEEDEKPETKPKKEKPKIEALEDLTVGELMRKKLEKERAELQRDLSKEPLPIKEIKSKRSIFDRILGFGHPKVMKETKQTERIGKPAILETVPAKVSVKEEIDLKKLIMNVEKLQIETSMLRNMREQIDERIQKISSDLGEIRSLSFQRDALIDEIKSKVRKLEEMVSEIEPRKITTKLKKKEMEMAEQSAKIEKLEAIVKDVSKRIKDVQNILENFKSLENLNEVRKDIEKKFMDIKHLQSDTKRYAGLAEKIHVDIDKKLTEMSILEKKIKKLEELLKETVSVVDRNKIELDNRVTKEDLKTLKDSIDKISSEVEDLKKIKEGIEPGVGFVEPPELTDKTVDLTKLRTENLSPEEVKNEIKEFLNLMNGYYKSGLISKETYEEIKKKNESYIKELEKQVKESEKMPVESKDVIPSKAVPPISGIKTTIEEDTGEKTEKLLILSRTLSELEKQKRDLENILFVTKKQYEEGIISEDAYKTIKGKTIDKLGLVNQRIATISNLTQTIKHGAKQ